MTVAGVLDSMTVVYDLLIGMFKNVIDMIVANPLVFVPVLFALLGGIVFFAIRIIRKLGVRGVTSTGRGRRRR